MSWARPFDGVWRLWVALSSAITTPSSATSSKGGVATSRTPDGTPVFREVPVQRRGEGDDEGLVMPHNMAAAYGDARAYCQLIAKVRPAAGFLKTLLLRRIGSSLRAGLLTARKLRSGEEAVLVGEEDEGLTREGVADVGSEVTCSPAMAIMLAIEAAMPSIQTVIAASWRFSAL
jgi:hypothetical protein